MRCVPWSLGPLIFFFFCSCSCLAPLFCVYGHVSGATPVVATGSRSGWLNGFSTPVFIGPLPTGEPTSLRSVSTPDQGGTRWKHPVLLIFFIYFFINCFTVHSLLSLLFKLYRSSSNILPLDRKA